MAQRVSPDLISDYLLENGERFVTTERLAELLGVRPARVSHVLATARHNSEIVSVTKGGWAPVLPAYRQKRRAPEVYDYLDDMMRFMGHEYYVGYDSAAAVYGAHHFSSLSFKIVTPHQHRERMVGRLPLQFIRGHVRPQLIQRRKRRFGVIWVTSPEATVFDLVARPRIAYGLDHVATIIGDMLTTDEIDGRKLAETATWYPRVAAQRVGYMAEIMQGHLAWAGADCLDLEPLADLVHDEASRPVRLDGRPHLSAEASRTDTGDKWLVRVDHVLDPAHKSRCETNA